MQEQSQHSTTESQHIRRLEPYVERARHFSGWDFSWIQTRDLEPGPPWNYDAVVRMYEGMAAAALDMGTGGGERLAQLRPGLPERLLATEEWKTNIPVAQARLKPLGVEVIVCQSRALPFADGRFDLVLNRHEELEPAEVARVLAPGGWIITQQIGCNNWRELRTYFPRMFNPGDVHAQYARGFEQAGLLLQQDQQHDHRIAYPGLGELVYMLSVTPWTIPGFDVQRDIQALLRFEREHASPDGLSITESRFLLVAQKPR